MITIPTTDLDLSTLAVPQPSQEERSELGQDDFLMLMIEQFRNQDPFQPMENGEFIAQMAQFSQVAGIAEMNESMGQLADSLSANQALQASTMVDRSVLADGNLGLQMIQPGGRVILDQLELAADRFGQTGVVSQRRGT